MLAPRAKGWGTYTGGGCGAGVGMSKSGGYIGASGIWVGWTGITMGWLEGVVCGFCQQSMVPYRGVAGPSRSTVGSRVWNCAEASAMAERAPPPS
eukprot:scaffold18435_cov113-Isochrysis_galbana.AAC.6